MRETIRGGYSLDTMSSVAPTPPSPKTAAATAHVHASLRRQYELADAPEAAAAGRCQLAASASAGSDSGSLSDHTLTIYLSFTLHCGTLVGCQGAGQEMAGMALRHSGRLRLTEWALSPTLSPASSPCLSQRAPSSCCCIAHHSVRCLVYRCVHLRSGGAYPPPVPVQ